MYLTRSHRLVVRLALQRRLVARFNSDGRVRRVGVLPEAGKTTVPDAEREIGRVSLQAAIELGLIELGLREATGVYRIEVTSTGRDALVASERHAAATKAPAILHPAERTE